MKKKNEVKEIDYSNSPIYTRAVDDTRHKILRSLQDIINIQATHGNWDYDPYMMGLANGLLIARSLIDNKEPKFFSKPKRWGKDYPVWYIKLKWKIFGYPKPVAGGQNEKIKEFV